MSSSQKDFIYNSLAQGFRIDGRNLIDHRNLDVMFGQEPGQVEFKLGNTTFFTKVMAELTEPKPDRPSEGFIKFRVDLSVLGEEKQSTEVKSLQIEIQKILEKVIKDSKVIDTKSLNIISGKQCWSIYVETTLVNNDGNLIDACYISVIIALMHFKKPKVNILPNRIEVLEDQKQRYQPLSINHIPLLFTFGLYQQTIIADTNYEETNYQDGRITIALNQYFDLCLVHKPGGISMNPEIITKILEVCKIKVKTFVEQIRSMLKKRDEQLIIRLNHLLGDDMDIEN